jgi:hypothetical protein
MSFKSLVFVVSNMSLAMEEICSRFPLQTNDTKARDRIADAMIASAQLGRIDHADLVDAGLAAVKAMEEPRRSWFGSSAGSPVNGFSRLRCLPLANATTEFIGRLWVGTGGCEPEHRRSRADHLGNWPR